SVNGSSVKTFEEVRDRIRMHTGNGTLEVLVNRNGVQRELTVRPQRVEDKDPFGNVYVRGQVGLLGGMPELVRRGPIESFYYATEATLDLTVMMARGLGEIITGHRSVEELGGPVKIAQVSGQHASLGLLTLISFMALISLNLGFVNLLPVPMLDGGHLFLYAIEAVRGRPVSQKVQEWAFLTGFMLVVSLMIFLTWNDLASFGLWDRLSGLLGCMRISAFLD